MSTTAEPKTERQAADADHATGQTPEAPSFAFDPTDPWTETFQRALTAANLTGKNVYEVGIGTGTNAAFLLRACKAARVSGSDLDPRLTDLAERNVRSLAPDDADRFHPVKGPVSLIDTPEALAEIAQTDVVIGCLPQVGDPNDARLKKFRESHTVSLGDGAETKADDHIAHYYPWTAFDDYPFNSVGLGLNEALLHRLRKYAPKADVILNFGCRIGIPQLMQLFEANNYTPEKLYGQVVRQDAGTDISFFVMLEKALQGSGMEKDFVCSFYADPEGKQPLSALEASALLEADPQTPLYHEVCSIRGRPRTDPA